MTQKQKIQKFKLLVGTHREMQPDDRIYRPGDVVESVLDLVAVHGSDKFVSLAKFEADAKDAVNKAMAQAQGEDVTNDFDEAAEAEVQVFKKKGRWAVYETDGTPIAGRLRKNQVVTAIGKYLGEDEAPDDDEDDEDDDDDE
jgi:hypothetical protein